MKYHLLVILALVFFLALANPLLAQAHSDPWPQHLGCTGENQVLYLSTPFIISPEVFELEERLLELGYETGKVDGIFDSETDRAVRMFQQDTYFEPNGRVNWQFWQALAKDSDKVVTSSTPPPENPIKIIIDLNRQVLTVFSAGGIYKEYPVAIGKEGTPSPVGEWRIIHKSIDWGGGFGSRWLGLNVPWGIYGIHGTNKPWSIGREVSHGCFRMFNQDIEEIYPWITHGTPVHVVGELKYFPWHRTRVLQQGSTGPDVVAVQLELKKEGLLWGNADGRYGNLTAIAIKYFQTLSGLQNNGIIEDVTRKALSL